MMLSDKINSLINDSELQAKQERERLSDLEDQKTLSECKKVFSLFNTIKTNTNKVADGSKALSLDSNKLVFVTTSKEAIGNNHYGILYSQKEVDLIEFLKSKKLPITDMIAEFESWMIKNGIISIKVKYEHDGGGTSSWNSYWIKTKQ